MMFLDQAGEEYDSAGESYRVLPAYSERIKRGQYRGKTAYFVPVRVSLRGYNGTRIWMGIVCVPFVFPPIDRFLRAKKPKTAAAAARLYVAAAEKPGAYKFQRVKPRMPGVRTPTNASEAVKKFATVKDMIRRVANSIMYANAYAKFQNRGL